jgi:hypothetical protein
MFDKGQVLLLWALECQPEMEPEWNEWYNREHIPGLLQVPGFISANRYENEAEKPLPPLPSMAAMPRYLSFYELYDEKVLDSEEYHTNRWSKAPGMRPEWTKRMMTVLTRIVGGIYRPISDTWLAGSDRSASKLWALFLQPIEGKQDTVDAWYREQLLPVLQDSGFVKACRLFGPLERSPDVVGMVRKSDQPQRIILTALKDDNISVDLLQDTWAAVDDEISNAISVFYRRMSL